MLQGFACVINLRVLFRNGIERVAVTLRVLSTVLSDVPLRYFKLSYVSPSLDTQLESENVFSP